jgi:hypothetical protein
MKSDRVNLCNDICRLIHTTRRKPEREFLSKQEMTQVHSYLVQVANRLIQLENELRILQTGL